MGGCRATGIRMPSIQRVLFSTSQSGEAIVAQGGCGSVETPACDVCSQASTSVISTANVKRNAVNLSVEKRAGILGAGRRSSTARSHREMDLR
jgi:hypothetical protein